MDLQKMECLALGWIKIDLDALQWQALLSVNETHDYLQGIELS